MSLLALVPEQTIGPTAVAVAVTGLTFVTASLLSLIRLRQGGWRTVRDALFLVGLMQPLTARGKAAAGIRLLDTRASTTRPVLAASRLIVSVSKLPAGLRGLFNPVITPDGSKVVSAAWTGPAGSLTAEIAEFSARTGRLFAVLLPPASMPGHGFPCTAVWTDPSGAHLVATCGVAGIVNGTRFTLRCRRHRQRHPLHRGQPAPPRHLRNHARPLPRLLSPRAQLQAL